MLALRLPEHVDEAPDRESPPPPRFALAYSTSAVTDPLAAAVALRALAGLLTLFLAFLLRAEGAPGLLVGLVVGAAALGQLSGTTLAARLPEGSPGCCRGSRSAGPFVACLGAALLGSDTWVVATAATTGVSVSLSRFALDAALQEHVTSRSLGSAFARSETALQLAWVLGAFVAVCLPTGDTGWRTVGFAVAAALPPLGLLLARRLPLEGEPQDLRRATSRRWRSRRTPVARARRSSGVLEQVVERVWWCCGLLGVPGDVEVVQLELALVPQDVVPSAEQHQVVHGRRAAVGAGSDVVGVAHGRWSGAAADDAAEVACGQVAALRWGDAVS